jgi:sugar phosphate isomerase/epimerase
MTGEPEAGTVTGKINVHGDLSGQAAIGKNIAMDMYTAPSAGPPTEPELRELRAAVEELRAQIRELAPEDLQSAAEERADELAEAVLGDSLDLSALEHLRNWFGRRLPQVGSAFTRLVFHPVLAQLVAAGGDGLVAEFKQRFG